MEHVYRTAEGYLGLEEWPGAKHNPQIVKMFAEAGHAWVKDDETPWCAAFVGAVLGQAGLRGSGKLDARSYLTWGEKVTEPELGDIVVLWRGSPDGWQGHVGFYAGMRGDYVLILGGNQGNAVSIEPYAKSRLLGYRRAKAPRESLTQSTSMQAITGGAVSGAVGVTTAVSALDGTAQIVVIVAALIAAAALAWVARERIRKWFEGDR
jgi:uncharacterized protein (TIGR02594 family)